MKKRTFNILGFGIFLFTLAVMPFSYVYADKVAPPLPKDKEEVFKGLQIKLKEEKQAAHTLKQKTDQSKKALEELREKMIGLGRSLQEQERALSNIEEQILRTKNQQQELKGILQENRDKLSQNLLAAIRMRRIPGETLFLQTSKPLHTAQTAMLLKETVPALRTYMDKISQQAESYKALQNELINKRAKKVKIFKKLKKQETALASMIAQRQQIIATTQTAYQTKQRVIKQMVKEAQSLQELIARVEKQNAERRRALNQKNAVQAPTKALPIAKPAFQQTQTPLGWPVAGTIETQFGDKDIYGAPSQGLKINTRRSALVTNPLEGKIRFAGTFKDYGQLVIVEHANGWHSLIAGLEKIDTLVGQHLEAGEPIGRMPDNGQNEPSLYYELRYQGQPVNPSKKIKTLS